MSSEPKIDQQLSSELRVQCYTLLSSERHPTGKAVHSAVELTWVTTGTARYRIGSQSLVVPAGCAIVVPAGVEHVTEVVSDLECGSIKIDNGMFEELSDAFQCRAPPTPGLVTDPRKLLSLGRLLRRELATQTEDEPTLPETLCESMAVEAARREALRRPSGPARDPRIRLALDRIQTGYAQPLTIADLAKTAGMSRFHFSRLFKEQLGASPYHYLLTFRIARAAALLRRGHQSVTEVAFDVGFQDLGRFSQAFRAQLGCLPSELLGHRGAGSTNRPTNRTIRGDQVRV